MKPRPVGATGLLRYVLWLIVAMLAIAYLAVLVASRY